MESSPFPVLSKNQQSADHAFGLRFARPQLEQQQLNSEQITIPGSLRACDAMHSYFGTDQQFRSYPVVRGRELLGMLDRDTLQELPREMLERPLSELLAQHAVDEFATPSDTCRTVASRLAAAGLERLPQQSK
jgi:hypothetical protein